MTATLCNCCHEQIPNESKPIKDELLGHICEVCCDGAEEGVRHLRKFGVSGVYFGRCPDQPEGYKP